MDFAAAHVSFVIAAYLVSFAGLAALVVFVLGRERGLRKEVQSLEQGRARRS